MKCYFCQDFDGSTEAQGQCRTDGRFVCRAHSAMRDAVLVCCECAFGGQEGVLKEALEDLGRISQTTCGGCGKQLVREKLLSRAFYLALTKERRVKVDAAFSYEVAYCPKGCRTCHDCQKSITRSFFSSSDTQCLACGKKYIEYTY